ncbi:MAG: GxxExxY protein [Candidatus Magasanikbacteria bacterium]|nr:GxxExxY protein [Candidatus Magasanikbacteria bacterium]
MLQEELSNKIIRAYYNVYNTLGFGFLEKVYENAMIVELRKLGIQGRKQVPIAVYYDTEQVGDYFADIVAEEVIILELKAAESLCEEHEAQLINYLRATNIEVGLLLNFGKKPEFKRKVFENKLKKSLHSFQSVKFV